MKKIPFASLLSVLLAVSRLTHPQCHAEPTEPLSQRPNILFLFTDDQPANCTGYSGNQAIQTPNLDTLAR
ncbi:MAG: acetylglucosamine-6-sulfatase, partial [Lacipirellulaceae bacterium]